VRVRLESAAVKASPPLDELPQQRRRRWRWAGAGGGGAGASASGNHRGNPIMVAVIMVEALVEICGGSNAGGVMEGC
jgi:hypothetical protein